MAKENTYSSYDNYSYHENSEYPTCAEGFDPFGNEEIDPDAGMDDFTGWPEGQEPDYDTPQVDGTESSWSVFDYCSSEARAAVQKAYEDAQTMAGDCLSNGYNTVSDIASSSYNTIGNALSSTASWVEEKGASFWDGILVEDTIGTCSEATTAVFDTISSAGGAIRDAVCDGISSAYDSISSIID